jgi:hypothetical protein
MKEYEVTCINKPDRLSTHEHITHIGNLAGQWRVTRELAIQKIHRKKSLCGRRQRGWQQVPVSEDTRRRQMER